jgi:hypothetical protein
MDALTVSSQSAHGKANVLFPILNTAVPDLTEPLA